MFNHDCTKHGHRYEGRFDTAPATGKINIEAPLSTIQEALSAAQAKTYIHDICVRCGDIKERKV